MRKLFNVKALAIFVFFMAGLFVSTTMNAQSTDFFFRVDNDDIYNDRAADGITIEGMHYENPTAPLGSGLLFMVAAGAGYAVLRRKRALKNGTTLLIMFALLLGMTQCKKKVVFPVETGTIYMTATASNCAKTVFVPNMGDGNSGFNWNSTGNEYVVVSGNSTGYLGELLAVAPGGNAATNRTEFSGTITAPSANDTKLFFFYLGNGSHTQSVGTASTIIDFSDQANGTTLSVTDYLIAVEELSTDEVEINGSQCHVTIDLRVKTAIAFFKLAGFASASSENETVYLHGADVYSSAEINFKTGEVIGKDKGYINVGTNNADGFYVSLIDSGTTTATTLQFDSNSNNGSIVFSNGIKGRMFYSDQLEQEFIPLSITATATLSEDVLPGLFSVAQGKMVRFSKGNLQYTRPDLNTPWSECQWSFMEPQYTVEESDEDVGINYCDKTKITLLGWGCTGGKDTQFGANENYFKPNNTKADSAVYYQDEEGKWHVISYPYSDQYGPYGSARSLSVANHSDWGWCMGGEQSPWRTLSSHEWTWLLGCEDSGSGLPNGTTATPGVTCRRSSTVCGKENARFLRAEINLSRSRVSGLIIFPDDYTQPDGITLTATYINYQTPYDGSWGHYDIISEDDWAEMEAAGAVFLPNASFRIGTYIYTGYNAPGNYWSSNSIGNTDARCLNVYGERLLIYSAGRCNGCSVRLVYDGE